MFTKNQLKEASKQAREGFHLPIEWTPNVFIKALENANNADTKFIPSAKNKAIRSLLGKYQVKVKEGKDARDKG